MEINVEDVKWPETLFDDDEPRQDGLHLGEVIRYITQLSSSNKKRASFLDMELTAEIGLLWERVLGKVMAEKYAIRPPQIQKDGVWMSPDGIGPDPDGILPMVVEEYKCTWQSMRRDLRDNFYYMTQAMSYCNAYDVNVAVFRVFYIMGDYRGSGPVYRQARIEYTRRELRDNWDMILRHKNEMEELD